MLPDCIPESQGWGHRSCCCGNRPPRLTHHHSPQNVGGEKKCSLGISVNLQWSAREEGINHNRSLLWKSPFLKEFGQHFTLK